MRITKVVDFCAAHSIAGAGKCEKKHGHNWEAKIEVDFEGKLDQRGFIADVAQIKQAAMKYDHDDLDLYFESASTENVCKQIADDVLDIVMSAQSEPHYISVHVHLIETKNNSADVVVQWPATLNINRFVGLKGAKNDETSSGRYLEDTGSDS